jgi:hypothetical protein
MIALVVEGWKIMRGIEAGEALEFRRRRVVFSVLSVVTECIVFGDRAVAAGWLTGIVTAFLEHRPTLAVRAVIAAGAKWQCRGIPRRTR